MSRKRENKSDNICPWNYANVDLRDCENVFMMQGRLARICDLANQKKSVGYSLVTEYGQSILYSKKNPFGLLLTSTKPNGGGMAHSNFVIGETDARFDPNDEHKYEEDRFKVLNRYRFRGCAARFLSMGDYINDDARTGAGCCTGLSYIMYIVYKHDFHDDKNLEKGINNFVEYLSKKTKNSKGKLVDEVTMSTLEQRTLALISKELEKFGGSDTGRAEIAGKPSSKKRKRESDEGAASEL